MPALHDVLASGKGSSSEEKTHLSKRLNGASLVHSVQSQEETCVGRALICGGIVTHTRSKPVCDILQIRIDKEAQPKRGVSPPRATKRSSITEAVSPAVDGPKRGSKGESSPAAHGQTRATEAAEPIKATIAKGPAEPSKTPVRRPATNFRMDSETESDEDDEVRPFEVALLFQVDDSAWLH